MIIHIFDRSDLNEIIALKPLPNGGCLKITRHEDLKEGCPRNDVVLVNCTRNNKQYCVYVTPTGYSGDLFVLEFLSDEQYNNLEGIAERMRANALNYEPAKKLINY
jgi:hypothetical protein